MTTILVNTLTGFGILVFSSLGLLFFWAISTLFSVIWGKKFHLKDSHATIAGIVSTTILLILSYYIGSIM